MLLSLGKWFYVLFYTGAVVIVWYFDLQLHVQSVPINTNVVSFNPTHGEVYSVRFIGGETVVPRENHRSAASQWQTLSHIVVLSTPRHEWDWNSQRWWYPREIYRYMRGYTLVKSHLSVRFVKNDLGAVID
jgi:hypothetical protein